MDQTFSISDLAREFDVTPRTIRHYEAEGLIAPARDGQRRIYSGRDRVRLALVLRGKRLGFSLAEAKEIIDLYSAPQGEAFQLLTLLEKLDEKREILEDKRRDLDAAISNMDKYAARCRDRLAELEERPETAAEAAE
ncbi:MAG: MerR family DNA-binding transcriptional regulator [Rhodospirillaceae bacterium]